MTNFSSAAIFSAVLGLGSYWMLREPAPASEPIALAAMTSAKSPARDYPVCTHGKRRDCVVDGDTFYHGVEKIRLADIDAPETHPPRCAHEADLGDRATVRLSQLLSAGAIELARFNRDTDRYGRKLRVAMRDGRSIGDMLVAEGLARTWTGKRQPWCGATEDSFG